MNRTGTYVAFDGQGSTDPTESDIHYFNLLKAWNKSGSIDFRFTNSHEKTYQVRDSSSKATFFNRLETRLSASKNFLLIISDKTNYDRGILNWEIEKAVDYYEAVHRHDFRHLVHIGGDHRHVPPAPQKVIPGSPYGKRCGACQSDPRDALRRPSPRRLPLRPLRPRPRGRCEVPRRPYRSRIARRQVGDEQPPDPMRRLQLRQGKPLPGITGERMTAIQELYTNNRKLSSLEKR